MHQLTVFLNLLPPVKPDSNLLPGGAALAGTVLGNILQAVIYIAAASALISLIMVAGGSLVSHSVMRRSGIIGVIVSVFTVAVAFTIPALIEAFGKAGGAG